MIRRQTLPLLLIAATLLALSLALVLLAIGGPALAQAPTDPATDIQVLAVAAETGNTSESAETRVAVDVAIPPSIGQLAPVADNFGVTVNGSLINNFDVAPLSDTVDIVMAIDTSGSMRGRPIADAKAAASEFVAQLPDKTRVGLIGFGNAVDVLNTPTTNRTETINGIESLTAQGETTLWDSLVTASELAQSETVPGAAQSQTYVVLLSDGGDTESVASQLEATTALRTAGVALYAIAINSPEASAPALADTVDAVGGNLATADNSAQLASVYQEVAARLANRYQLTFSSGGAEAGKIVISVVAPGNPEADPGATSGSVGVATAQTFFDVRSSVDTETADGKAVDGPARILNLPDTAVLGIVESQAPGVLGSDRLLPVGSTAVFLALLLFGALILNPAADIRLEAAAGADRATGVSQRLSTLAENVVKRRDSSGRLDRSLDAAGINLRPGEFVLAITTAILVVALLVTLITGFFAGLLVIFIGVAMVVVYLNGRAGRRRTKFADQLTDTLTIMIGSLRAGRGLPQALELVAAEASSPTSEQFRRVVYETRVGRDMTESMMEVAKRMQSQDFEWVTRAVDINRELGGDLIEVLENVAGTIRSRQRVSRMVRSLSAEGRASGWVMLSLPILMFLFMLWRTPDNAGLMLSHSLGRVMLLVAMLGMVAGYFWIRKLVDLRY